MAAPHLVDGSTQMYARTVLRNSMIYCKQLGKIPSYGRYFMLLLGSP